MAAAHPGDPCYTEGVVGRLLIAYQGLPCCMECYAD